MKKRWEVIRQNMFRGLHLIYHAGYENRKLNFTFEVSEGLYKDAWGDSSFKIWDVKTSNTTNLFVVVNDYLIEL